MLSISWCESHLILPLGVLMSVGAVVIIQDLRRVWLHWQDGIESQRMWPIHWAPIKSLWFRIYHITLHERTQAIPGSDLGLIELMLRVFTTNLLTQTLGCLWMLINLYRCLVPHCAYLTLLCRMKSGIIHWNTRGGGAILDYPLLCEDETTTRECECGSSAL